MAANWIVRHGAMRFLGEFDPEGRDYMRGAEVVVRTERGLELGQSALRGVAADRADALGADARPGRPRPDRPGPGRARPARARPRPASWRRAADSSLERRLQMELVDVEHLFGGERIVFYFLAEKRVDFRELVKDLAREYQTRIEMRQIGVRDEAKLLADYGDCGKPVCCNTHMAVMPPVSMRMAKLQKSTLDPSKISGRCGRLKCCLRFEQDVYEEFQAELPPVGARVVTPKGQGRVLAQEVLARKVLVEFEDGRRIPVAAAEILTRLGR